jgi:hypothetical protein
MSAYAELQEAEFAAGAHGYTATRHQREVGTGYFDEVSLVISSGESSTTALHGSTETAQFETPRSAVAFHQSKQLRKRRRRAGAERQASDRLGNNSTPGL